MSRVVVTGGCGYLGAATVAALRRAGYDAVAVDTGENARVDELGAARIVDVDVTDRSAVLAAFGVLDPDAVVHLAAVPGVETCREHPAAAARVNVNGTQHVGEWCRASDTPLAFASTAGVYGPGTPMPIVPGRPRRPTHFYGETKRAAEDVLAAFATDTAPVVALEKTNLYGQYDVGGETVQKAVAANFFVERALAGEPIPVHRPGWQTRDFLHVLDAARAYLAVVEELLEADPVGFRRLVVGGEDEWTIRAVAERVARETGATIELVENPSAGPYYDRFTVDTVAVTEFCGWEPERSLEELVDAKIRAAAD